MPFVRNRIFIVILTNDEFFIILFVNHIPELTPQLTNDNKNINININLLK